VPEDLLEVALPLTRHHLSFRAEAAGRWPRYPGSAWRGGFGHALKRTVCVMRLRPCAGCPLERSCVYPTVFETAPGEQAAMMRRYDRVPHPFVLQPPVATHDRLESGDLVSLQVTLVGRSAGHAAYVVRALQEAAAAGLGPDRLALELRTLGAMPMDRPLDPASAAAGGLELRPTPPPVPPCPTAVEVELVTPLRLQREGRLVGAETFAPADLLRNLVRRVSMLRYFFTDRPLEADFPLLRELALGLPAEAAALRWVDLVRRSSRQDMVMRMGGIVGRFRLPIGSAQPLWPFLWLGQWIGAGKGATMGLGQLRLQPCPGP
jgi:hypothetical protein